CAIASLTSSKASSCRRECSSGEVCGTSGGEMTRSAIEGRITLAQVMAQPPQERAIQKKPRLQKPAEPFASRNELLTVLVLTREAEPDWPPAYEKEPESRAQRWPPQVVLAERGRPRAQPSAESKAARPRISAWSWDRWWGLRREARKPDREE